MKFIVFVRLCLIECNVAKLLYSAATFYFPGKSFEYRRGTVAAFVVPVCAHPGSEAKKSRASPAYIAERGVKKYG
jgi:hypothetical protein